MDLFDPSFGHDLDSLRADVYGTDGQSSFLKYQTMASRSSADIQYIAPAEVEGGPLYGREVRGRSEEEAYRGIPF